MTPSIQTASAPRRRQAGNIFLVVAPSGAGKSTLVNALLERDPGIVLSVSHTTRPPRPGEQSGREYHFVSVDEFMRLRAAGEFLESAEVHGNYYATSRVWIEERIRAGTDVLLEIDWQGARQVKARFSHAVGIFILPPSIDALEARLHKRGQDSPQVICTPAARRRQRDRARARVRLRDHQRGLRHRAGAAQRPSSPRRACATAARRRGTTAVRATRNRIIALAVYATLRVARAPLAARPLRDRSSLKCERASGGRAPARSVHGASITGAAPRVTALFDASRPGDLARRLESGLTPFPSENPMARITVEDCLKQIPNRFQLALAAAYRARQLAQGHTPKIDTKDKPAVAALREIAQCKVGIEMLRKVPIVRLARGLHRVTPAPTPGKHDAATGSCTPLQSALRSRALPGAPPKR